MAPPAPRQPKALCRLPAQLVIEAALLGAAAAAPFELALVLVLGALAFPIYCFAQAEPPEKTES